MVDCPLPEVFFGGARGGGKTDGVLGKWAIKEQRYGRHFNARMFRKATTTSEDAIERAKEIYVPLGAKFNESKLTFRMPHGGRVSFGYLDSVQDADAEQGKNRTDAWVEEAGQHASPIAIDRLFGALRSAHGVPTQLILTANPGGAGQHWLSDRYGLIPFPVGPKIVTRALGDGTLHRMAVIPSRITDNKILLDSDPGYMSRLQLVGSAALIRAWLEGDWSAIEGAFFPEWSEARHVVAPFEVPSQWARFRSMDWGSASPFSVGWWAVVSDQITFADGRVAPRGALVRYREWYGASAPNVGLKLTAEQIADGIADREAEERARGASISYGVLDPAAFKEDGGPSWPERMAARRPTVQFIPADNARVSGIGSLGGWDMMRQRLRGDGATPMLFAFSTCKAFIRQVATAQHDQAKPEDLDTNTEDHALDEARYGCMSRPWVASAKSDGKKKAARDYGERLDGDDDDDVGLAHGLMDDIAYHAWLLEMFTDAEEATERSREKAARDLDYYDGKQWTEKEVRELTRRGQPAITLNLIRNKVDYLQGLERTQRTKPRALPRTPSDEDQAHAATDALGFVADQNRYDDQRSRVWGDLLKVGWGGHEITVEPRSQRQYPAGASTAPMMGSTALTPPPAPEYDVKVRRCQWDRMFWDPYSTEEDFLDAAYLGMVVWLDRDEAIRKYGKGAGQVFDDTVTGEFQTFGDKPQYETWVRNGTRKRVRIVQIYHVNADDGEWDFCEFTKGGILQDGPSPWLDDDGKREHPYSWRSAYIDRDNNRYGAIRDMIDPQDEMNKRRSKALHHFTTRQTFGTQGLMGDKTVKDLRRELSRPDGHVEMAFGKKFGEDFGIIPTADMASGHMELLNQAASVFETMGPNAAMQGKESGAPSGRALLASQQGGTIQLGTLTDALRQMDFATYRKVWLRIKQFWTSETWIRVTDDMANLKWVGLNTPKKQMDPQTGQPAIDPTTGGVAYQIDPMTGQPAIDNDVSGLDVDIIIDEAPSNGTLADEQFQMLVQLKQMDQKDEIPFSYIINAAPNLRNKQDLVQATRQRESQPPNPMEVAGAQAKLAEVQSMTALKTAQAGEVRAKTQLYGADAAQKEADTRKTVVDTHASAVGSVLDAAQAAQALQAPLVQTPAGYTVPSGP